MASVGDFLKFLNAPQFQLSPITLTIKNYFQFLFRADEELSADIVQSFFDHAMSYPHWQQHKTELSEECENLFTEFLTQMGEGGFLNELDWPEQIQVIDVARAPTALEILHNFWTFRFKKNSGQFRVFEMGDGRFATVILHADHKVAVHQSNSQFLIRNGNLEPVQRNLVVHYTADLDLDPNTAHTVEVAPYTLCRFHASNGTAQGHLVRGYVFQNLQSLQGQRLEIHPRLFFALKRLETLFIRKESDPFYSQLIENLERLLHWMRLGEPINTVEVHETYLRAQTALEEVFRGDKMLTLLLRDLEHLTARALGRDEALTIKRPPRAEDEDRWTRAKLQGPTANSFKELSSSPKLESSLPNRGRRVEKKWPIDEANLQPLNKAAMEESVSTKSLRTAAWPRDERPTASSRTATSPSTERKSTSSGSKSIPKKTKFSWMENP